MGEMAFGMFLDTAPFAYVYRVVCSLAETPGPVKAPILHPFLMMMAGTLTAPDRGLVLHVTRAVVSRVRSGTK